MFLTVENTDINSHEPAIIAAPFLTEDGDVPLEASFLSHQFPRNTIRDIEMVMAPEAESLMRLIKPTSIIVDKGAIGRYPITFDGSKPSTENMAYALSNDRETFQTFLASRSQLASFIGKLMGTGSLNKPIDIGVLRGTSSSVELACSSAGILEPFSPSGRAGLVAFLEYVLKAYGVIAVSKPITMLEDRYIPHLTLDALKTHWSTIVIRDAIESVRFTVPGTDKAKKIYVEAMVQHIHTLFQQMLPTLRASMKLNEHIEHALELVARYVMNPDDVTAIPDFLYGSAELEGLASNLTIIMMALEQRQRVQGALSDGLMTLAHRSTEDHIRALQQLDRLITTSPRYSVMSLSDVRAFYGHEAIVAQDRTPRGVVIYQNMEIESKIQITNFFKVDDTDSMWYQSPAQEYEAMFAPFMQAVKEDVSTDKAARLAVQSLSLVAEAIPHPCWVGICVSDIGIQYYAAAMAEELYISVNRDWQEASLVYQVDVKHLNFPKLAFGSSYLTRDPAALLMLLPESHVPTASPENKIQLIPDECRGHLLQGSLKGITERLNRTIDLKLNISNKTYSHSVSIAEITNMFSSLDPRITRSPMTAVVGSAYLGTVVNLVTYLRAIAAATPEQMKTTLYSYVYDQEGDIDNPSWVNRELELDSSIGHISVTMALEMQKIFFHPAVKYLGRSVMWKIIEQIPNRDERLSIKNAFYMAKHNIELHRHLAVALLVRLGIMPYALLKSVNHLMVRTDVMAHLIRLEGNIVSPR